MEDKLDVLCSRWEDMNDTLTDLINNFNIFDEDIDINDILEKCNNFFKFYKSNKKQDNQKDKINNFYKRKWKIFYDCFSKCRLPINLVELMNNLIKYSPKIEKSDVKSTLIQDYESFTNLLNQVLEINERNSQKLCSTDSESIYISEVAFDFFPAIFFSLGVIKHRLLSTQDEEFKDQLKEFEKLMKEIDKVNYCKRLYLVMDGEFRIFIHG